MAGGHLFGESSNSLIFQQSLQVPIHFTVLSFCDTAMQRELPTVCSKLQWHHLTINTAGGVRVSG